MKENDTNIFEKILCIFEFYFFTYHYLELFPIRDMHTTPLLPLSPRKRSFFRKIFYVDTYKKKSFGPQVRIWRPSSPQKLPYLPERCRLCWTEWNINFPIFIFQVMVDCIYNLLMSPQFPWVSATKNFFFHMWSSLLVFTRSVH